MAHPAYLASLRVFAPLSTLPQGERRRWERYVAAGRAPDRQGLADSEHVAGLLAAVRPTLDVDTEHALVEVVDGVTYICPARTQLRVWEAAAAFREGLPDLLADAFIPPALAAEAADQLTGWRAVSPDVLPHIRISPWHIPLAWFLFFEADERRTRQRSDVPTLRYTTPMSAARRRGARALQVLRRTLPEAPALEELEQVARWLEEFHPYCRVELDYGALAALMATVLGEQDLAGDTSVGDLEDGLQALRQGDGAAAGASYQRVTERWHQLRLRENAS